MKFPYAPVPVEQIGRNAVWERRSRVDDVLFLQREKIRVHADDAMFSLAARPPFYIHSARFAATCAACYNKKTGGADAPPEGQNQITAAADMGGISKLPSKQVSSSSSTSLYRLSVCPSFRTGVTVMEFSSS